jgi:hypothetical protein
MFALYDFADLAVLENSQDMVDELKLFLVYEKNNLLRVEKIKRLITDLFLTILMKRMK